MSQIETVTIANETFFKISNSDALRPFFMNIVSDSNHWMFISSNGGLSAGRKNAEFSLFPYYTDDKITESTEITGSKTIFQITKNNKNYVWEPFSDRYDGMHTITRNLYKNTYGNKVMFEEINHDLQLTFRYQWNSSDTYGFVKKSTLTNNADETVSITLLDGIQNILPYGVGADLQNASSNLVDAYKRNELDERSGLGIFALSAIIVDKAEPSEALKANIAWSLGFENATYLVSSLQLKQFRDGNAVTQETDVKAEKGAYFIHAELNLQASESNEWMTIANVNQDHASITKLIHHIENDQNLAEKVQQDIELGNKKLVALVAASDGLQLSADKYRDTRHFSNTLFNIMRGGIFDDNYQIEKWDFKNYLENANKNVALTAADTVNALQDVFTVQKLNEIANNSHDQDFKRLCLEYMPLKFSRRHGDPSRPWNKFSINTRSEIDGSKILDYEGNWRDIFQNWEALAYSYPEFVESMIHKFLNATTFDGYNPYRVTKGGFDWETIEPDDPWSYIGYWGDHQIIYLQKLLEIIENHQPGRLDNLFTKNIFVYANVPYRIKSYEDILKNPKDTIEFDEASDHSIRQEREKLGADGALLHNQNKDIIHVNFIEKILATTLAKLSNFIPEGGIWMNTQRPEWNDANNALVGNGVSMVTLYYLRRFLKFFDEIFTKTTTETVEISEEIAEFFQKVADTFASHRHLLQGKIDDADRKKVLDGVGKAGSDFRLHIYDNAFSGKKTVVSISTIKEFTATSLEYLEHSIGANRRNDNMYHAYNLMTVEDNGAISISYLDEMLEGQVAVLSSGYISSKEALAVLDGLKSSKLFRDDQYSYLLYPNKELKGFMQRNTIPKEAAEKSNLMQQLLQENNNSIVTRDINGAYHFNGNFKNAGDVKAALNKLKQTNYKETVEKEASYILEVFEEVFNHKAFTGRSGTFYGYEGLGSIYWHMVSKLQLAVFECCIKAIRENESDETIGRLLAHYYEINEGIGVHKSPSLYGAFPTDPYSHTPAGKGAQQPGMTGQVKEDILSRFGELGVFVENGELYFDPCMLRKDEFLQKESTFNYVNLAKEKKQLQVLENSLCFTYCQVPVIYTIADSYGLTIHHKDGTTKTVENLRLDAMTSQQIFNRTGEVTQINVHIKKSHLK